MDRCLITAASNKYFPSVLNLVGSLNTNYPSHPLVFVYDLGLSYFWKKILSGLDGVKLISMPDFCPFWRSCYTWKTYIFANPLARLNLYLDAGTEILRPLDDIFGQIESNGYFALTVDPRLPLKKITPPDYKEGFGLAESLYQEPCLAAGLFGFKQGPPLDHILSGVYKRAKEGAALGFSPAEKWRDKGQDRSGLVRDCAIFRHDQTLLNLAMRDSLGKFYLNTQTDQPEFPELHRLSAPFVNIIGRYYQSLPYAKNLLKNSPTKTMLLSIFIWIKRQRLSVKKYFGLIKNQYGPICR